MMRTLFVINRVTDQTWLENQYLLCLAMLNFDHQVNVVFVEDAFEQVMQLEATAKQWSALSLYGAQVFQLTDPTNHGHSDNRLSPINEAEFDRLKTEMDFIS